MNQEQGDSVTVVVKPRARAPGAEERGPVAAGAGARVGRPHVLDRRQLRPLPRVPFAFLPAGMNGR